MPIFKTPDFCFYVVLGIIDYLNKELIDCITVDFDEKASQIEGLLFGFVQYRMSDVINSVVPKV